MDGSIKERRKKARKTEGKSRLKETGVKRNGENESIMGGGRENASCRPGLRKSGCHVVVPPFFKK